MICSEKFAFIHCQKTGGMSMTRYLVNVTDEPVTVFSHEKSHVQTRNMAVTPDRAEKLTCLSGERHEPPAQAIETLKRCNLPVPPWAFVMIRHPADLMMSFYKNLQKPRVWQHRGMTRKTVTGHVKLALENPFAEFCEKVRFYGRDDDQLAAFFEPHGFGRLDVVPLERISEFLEIRFGRNRNFAGIDLGHQNKSKSGTKAMDPQVRAMICDTYPRLLATYEQACAARWQPQD